VGVFGGVFGAFDEEADFAEGFADAIITMAGDYIKRCMFDIGLSCLNCMMAKWMTINDEEVNGLEEAVYKRLMESFLGKCLPVFISIDTTWVIYE
jgi:hypothetical protein